MWRKFKLYSARPLDKRTLKDALFQTLQNAISNTIYAYHFTGYTTFLMFISISKSLQNQLTFNDRLPLILDYRRSAPDNQICTKLCKTDVIGNNKFGG